MDKKTSNNDITFKQVTSVEHFEDNEETFTSMIKSIKEGHANSVVEEMKSWPKSDLDPIYYSEILNMAGEHNESIVYDDFNYLLAANDNIIVLYQRI